MAVPTVSAAAPAIASVPAIAAGREAETPVVEDMILERNFIADLPLLTVGLIVLLMLIYGAEKGLAFDIGKDGQLSIQSLIAFGAVSYDLTIGSGQWWRIGLAPLLHASTWHLVGNCFALFCVGLRLERMIGHGWFALIFAISAFGGVAGSLYGNPHDMPSVGASGAITGLIGALFVVSFHHRADAVDQRAMRKTSLFFGIPALLPLALAAQGQTDYFAHAGGAIAGCAVALILCAVWASDCARPDLPRLAGLAALTALAVSMLCSGFAARHYAAYAAEAAQLVPSSEMPTTLQAGSGRSADLVTRYPNDPRAHLLHAVSMLEARRHFQAEAELRKAMALVSSDAGGRMLRNQAQAILAVILNEQGRYSEAKTMAAEPCRAKEPATVRRTLEKEGLCF